MNLFSFPFLCLLSAALIGWLVGWLLGRLSKGRPSESLDAELAGKMRLLEEERNRLQYEIAQLRSSFRSQLDKTNSELSEARLAATERNALRGELETALSRLTILEQKQNPLKGAESELSSLKKIVEQYETDLRAKEGLVELLRSQLAEAETPRWELQNIEFLVDSDEITAPAERVLEEAAQALKSIESSSVIEIEGHTDNIDNEEHNRDLSRRRAETVRAFLISRGVPPQKLRAVGYGASHPIADNATEDGRRRNRRIEFSLQQSS